MEFNFQENNIDNDAVFDEKIFNDIFQYEDRIIFLVDYDAINFQNDGIDENNSQIFIRLFSQFVVNKMKSNSSCKIGLIFYNYYQQHNDFDFPFIYIYHNLENIQAEWIKKIGDLERFLIKSDHLKNYHADLEKVYNVCERQFNQCTTEIKNHYQRIFLFTNQDNPYFLSKVQKDTFKQQISNLQSNNIEIDLFPLQFSEPFFNVQKFYGKVLKIDLDEVNSEFIEPIQKLEQLNLKLKKKQTKKRPVFKSKLQLGKDTFIGMKVYSLYKKLKKQSSIILNKSNNQLLKKAKVPQLDNSGQKISEDLIEKRLVVSDEQILFTEEDLNDIKNFIQEQFCIVGFKPRSRPSFFLVPDECQIKGSSQSFDALINEMKRKDQVGIMKLKANQSYMKFAFLIPQVEKIIDNQFQPPGLHVVISPFADDIRDLSSIEPQENQVLSEIDIQVASNLVEALTIEDFDPKNFQNPTLQHFYHKLQQMALEDVDNTQIQDLMLPDYEGIVQQQNIIDQFNNHFFSNDQGQNNESFVENNNTKEIIDQEVSNQNTEIKSQNSQHKHDEFIDDIIQKVLQDEKVLVKELNKVLDYLQLTYNNKTKKYTKIMMIKNNLQNTHN